jgi:hypothetical protein
MLPSSKALIPPRLQTPTRLNGVIYQDIPLRCDQLLYTTLYSQEPPVPKISIGRVSAKELEV